MDTEPPPPPPLATPLVASSSEDNTVAIISYLSPVGFIVAAILHTKNKTKIGAFHLRQSLGLIITAVAISIGFALISAILPFLVFLLFPVYSLLWVGVIVLAIVGLIAAANRKFTPIPFLGDQYVKYLGTAFD